MFIVALILSYYYLAILLLLAAGIFKLKRVKNESVQQRISVIIAARNEENNIANLLNCLTQQNYPRDRFEVILADDRSTDRTGESVEEFINREENIRYVRIVPEEPGGKKRALARGISAARFPILAFTDADCLPPSDWLSEINSYFTEDTDFLAGYSPLIRDKDTLLLQLKNLERLSIYAVMAGGMGWNLGLTCTARNMAYRKTLFEKVNGFSGLEDIPSGDDDLMIQRMTPCIRKMNFMFSSGSVVPSHDNQSAVAQVNLETRRASKWRLYPLFIKIGTALIFLYYLSFLLALLITIVGRLSLSSFIVLLSLKVLAELTILIPFLLKIGKGNYLTIYPLAFILHLPYFLFFALKGTFGRYRWK